MAATVERLAASKAFATGVPACWGRLVVKSAAFDWVSDWVSAWVVG